MTRHWQVRYLDIYLFYVITQIELTELWFYVTLNKNYYYYTHLTALCPGLPG